LRKNLRDIIGHVLNATSVPETAGFLDNMKIWDTSLPLKVDCHSHGRLEFRSKPQLIADARTQVEGISVKL
jgi:DNA-directed RNA polymerase subunit beta'